MPDHGAQLGVDLNELYRTAHFLTVVGDDYEEAVRHLNDAQPPPASGPWVTSPPGWDNLRSVLSELLGGNAAVIQDTAAALNVITERYLRADQGAAAKLRSLEQTDSTEQGW